MSSIETLLNSPLSADLGRVFLHLLWEGAAIAIVLGLGLGLLQRATPRTRYLACCIALFSMVLAPGITYFLVATAPARGAVEGELTVALLEALQAVAPQSSSRLLPLLGMFWIAGSLLVQVRNVRQWRAARRLYHEARCGHQGARENPWYSP